MPPSAKSAGGRGSTRWTRDTIIEKIALWAASFGAPPCSADWNPSLARWRGQDWRIERYAGGGWPSTNAVKRHFGGSFDAAVVAAGFAPARPGPKPATRIAQAPMSEDLERSRFARTLDRDLADLERRLARAERRAVSAEERAGEARRRARLASERESRARRARERVADTIEAVEERVEAIAEDADARVRAAEDQAQAAAREATGAERRAAAAEARASAAQALARAAERVGAAARAGGVGAALDAARDAELRAAALEAEVRELGRLVTGERRRLSAAELATLRAGGPSGPAVLAHALRSLAAARASGDRAALSHALATVAAAAVGWGEHL
jgi:hypothetical protein